MSHATATVVVGDADWRAFIARLETAEEAFAEGRPAAFKALWSHGSDVTLSGGLGGRIERGWEAVATRLDWASGQYGEGVRSRHEVGGAVDGGFAYIVQTETIEFRPPGGQGRSRQELRVTMVFRKEAAGWRIVHRHADGQTQTHTPRT